MYSIVKEGYVFSSLSEEVYKTNQRYPAIVIRNPKKANIFAPIYGFSDKSLEEHIQYINEHHLEYAIVIADDIHFLTKCPTLKHLQIIPSDAAQNGFDFSPLYDMPEIQSLICRSQYGISEQYIGEIDYLKIHGLKRIALEGSSKGNRNFNKIERLKVLKISRFKGKNRDLSDLFCSTGLEELIMYFGNMYSLNGIETSHSLKSLELYYQRCLKDISQLNRIKNTLTKLCFENCPKIQDFSVLAELENLEHLSIMGKNEIPSLSFLKHLKKLKFFTFNVNVLDGDLTPCLSIPYAWCEFNRHHYNLKDSDLNSRAKIPFALADGMDSTKKLLAS